MLLVLPLITILKVALVLSIPENFYDDDSGLYMGYLPSNRKYQNALQGGEQLEDTALHYGRNRDDRYIMPLRDDYEFEYDDFNAEFARPTRAQDKTDNFVRFGRGNSDFVRFGRDPHRHQHQIRTDQNFVRFGRNLRDIEASTKRTKRSTPLQLKEKRRNQDDFLRFGRGGDDSFVRYGRNDMHGINIEDTPAPTKPNNFIHRQSLDYPYAYKERLLFNIPLLTLLRKLEELKEKN